MCVCACVCVCVCVCVCACVCVCVCVLQEIVVGSNMDKIYIVMDYVEHDLKSLMETMKTPFIIGKSCQCPTCPRCAVY